MILDASWLMVRRRKAHFNDFAHLWRTEAGTYFGLIPTIHHRLRIRAFKARWFIVVLKGRATNMFSSCGVSVSSQ